MKYLGQGTCIQCFLKNISWLLPNHKDRGRPTECVLWLGDVTIRHGGGKKVCIYMSSRPSGAYLRWAGFTQPQWIQPRGDQWLDLEPKPRKRALTLTAGLRTWVVDIHVIIRSPPDWSQLHTHTLTVLLNFRCNISPAHVSDSLVWSSRWALKISTALLPL